MPTYLNSRGKYWRQLCGVIVSENIRIQPSTRTRDVIGFTNFHSGGRITKKLRICLRIRWMRVEDSRIRKEKVADSKISGYVWTGPWSAEDVMISSGCTVVSLLHIGESVSLTAQLNI